MESFKYSNGNVTRTNQCFKRFFPYTISRLNSGGSEYGNWIGIDFFDEDNLIENEAAWHVWIEEMDIYKYDSQSRMYRYYSSMDPYINYGRYVEFRGLPNHRYGSYKIHLKGEKYFCPHGDEHYLYFEYENNHLGEMSFIGMLDGDELKEINNH